ncbi:hypothetical protein IV203_036882 [Nitzschia inconspicua]|uniref:Uncharacterized protein n=1 Tax=Nitzschia inconspicua TaxID=303405 RepID=A0A9K3PW95_9STRA|nr:hypothetical protein IV203_036882 [Nitzschia inconspicua]
MPFSFSSGTSSVPLIAAVSLLVSFYYNCCSFVKADGVQSGPSQGPFYSGGMVYDPANQMIYMAGLHYNNNLDGNLELLEGTEVDLTASNCFVAMIDMSSDDGEFDVFDEWNNFGSPGIMEACSSLTVHSPTQLIVVGSAEPGGNIIPTADTSIPMSGMVMVVEQNSLDLLEGAPLTTSAEPTTSLLYPVSVVSDNADSVYIVALTSTDGEINPTVNPSQPFNNWQQTLKYGTSQDMTIIKVSFSQSSGAEIDGVPVGSTVVEEVWTREFPVEEIYHLEEDERERPKVYIGGLIFKRDSTNNQEYLIVAGSTRGLGDGYGNAEGDDEDGFITVLDPATGDLHASTTNSMREGSAEDDIVTGICDDPYDETSFFVVGATKGGDLGKVQADSSLIEQLPPGSLQPFVRKVRVDSLSEVWTNQWVALPTESSTAPTAAFAAGCVVDNDTVYVTGTVKAGASMVQDSTRQPSQGEDDIWVARMDKTGGTVSWMNQLGSNGDEQVAPHGGVVTNSQGDVMIFGDTTGSLYRQRATDGTDTVADMFVMSLDSVTGGILDSDYLGGTSIETVEEVATDAPTSLDETGDDEPVDGPEDQPAPTTPSVDAGSAPTYAPVPPQKEGHQYTAVGLQIPGPGYAGGLVYIDDSNSVLLAGATYVDDAGSTTESSNCFTGEVDLDNGNLVTKFARGSTSLPESCSAISYDPLRNAAYAIGGMQAGAQDEEFLSDALWSGTENSVQAGLIMQMNEKLRLIGGNRIVGYPVVYPVAVVNDVGEPYVYVASMVSNDSTGNDAGSDIDNEHPDYTTGGRRDFGSNFFVSVEQYVVDSVDGVPVEPLPASVKETWASSFQTDSGSVTVSGMTLGGNGHTLIVVGSTKGSGGPFGDNDGEDMDGWIIKLDPKTGQLSQGEDGQERSSTRLDSVNKQDDMILQVCNDRFNHDAFYVVGTSAGKVRSLPDDQQPPEGSFHAFVAKISIKGLSADWLKHFTMMIPGGGPGYGEALACTVTHETDGKNIVYVGGNIKNGALVDGTPDLSQSNGGDDIFVAAMDGSSGALNWIRQIGTPENDRLASGDGLDIDSFGNVIVFGETNGSMYGSNNGGTEMILFTMNKNDGAYLTRKTNGEGVGDSTPESVISDSQSAPALPETAVALQTGPDVGPSYAGGMIYDAFTDALYLTGATYGTFGDPEASASSSSMCFLGVVSLPKLQWKEREVFGTSGAVPEACSAITLASYLGRSEVMMVGSTEPGGLLSGLSSSGSNAQQIGMILDLSNQAGNYQLLGGAVADASEVQFPIQVIANEHQIFMVAMASRDRTVRPDFRDTDEQFPNLTTGGVEKYGSDYSIVVERHTINRGADVGGAVLQQTMNLDWRKPFETADQQSVYVSGMAIIDAGEALVVVGSTREQGGDFDGIMAKVNVEDGSFQSEASTSRSVAYFSSLYGSDDWIHGVCTDPDDPESFYLVGATGGSKNGSPTQDSNIDAIVAKIRTIDLDIEWSVEIGTIPPPGMEFSTARALGCDVVRGAGYIYIAGNVEKGAVILNENDPQQSFGSDDIFVSMLETRSGEIVWLKQVGSYGDDRVAHGGGIASDKNGNAVVYGDTNGEFYRNRNDDSNPSFSDIFLTVFNQADGGHIPPYSIGWASSGSSTIFSDPKYLAFAITVLVMLAMSVFCFCYARHVQYKRAEAQKSSIFGYLQAFDVEDIDLRKSPPGGWHGTYLNKLAYGINKADTGDHLPEALETAPCSSNGSGSPTLEMAPLASLMNTHSSIVKDSLFMDTMSTPSLGNQDYYDDLTPRNLEERRGSVRRGSSNELI